MEIIWNYEWNIEIPCEHHPGQQQTRQNCLLALHQTKKKKIQKTLGHYYYQPGWAGDSHLERSAKWKKIKFSTVFLIETLAKTF